MDVRKKFGASKRSETEGVEFRLDGTASITLARAGGGNVKFDAAMKRNFGPYRRAVDAGTLDDETATACLQRAYAEAVVLGWRGIEIDGEALEFSEDNVLRVFKEAPDLWRIIQREATKLENYLQEDARETGKELPMS